MRRAISCLVAVAVLLVACGGGSGQGSPSAGGFQPEGNDRGGPPIDWDHPLSDGVTVNSASAADAAVPFNVVEPAFAKPDLIQIDDPTRVPPSEETVAFVFHLPDYGTVLVEEREQGDWTIEQMQARADDPSAAPDTFQMVPVRNTKGLLIQADGIGRIMWIENGVLFDITGPTILPMQVIGLASQL